MILQNLLENYEQSIRDHVTGFSSFHIHLLWMIDEIQKMILSIDKTDRVETIFKINRWLGFIQGYLHSNKLKTIEELKNETRGIDDELFKMLDRNR